MDKKKFIKQLAVLHTQFEDELWPQVEKLVNSFREEHEPTTPEYEEEIDKFIEHLCLSGSWLYDRIAGNSTNVGAKEYRKSLTKKVRKVLGFTL